MRAYPVLFLPSFLFLLRPYVLNLSSCFQNKRQVPLLLSMGENELGLKKAILSGEDDLVYLAVMHIEREAGSSEKGREAFHQLMHAHPEALRLLKVLDVTIVYHQYVE